MILEYNILANKMRKKLPLMGLWLGMILLMGACAPFAAEISSQEQLQAVVELQNVSTGLQPIDIADVQTQIGVGSPIMVEIIASGTWPGLCSQIAEMKSSLEGFAMNIEILASVPEDCPPDFLGLPFRMALPINAVELPAGDYNIAVNGVSTTLTLPAQP